MFPAKSLYVVIRPSIRYALALLVAHGMGLAGLLAASPFELPLKLALSLAVALSCWHTISHQALLSSDDAVLRLTWSDKEYFLTTRGGDLVRAQLHTSLALRWLLVLNFREPAAGAQAGASRSQGLRLPWRRRKNWSVVIVPGMVTAMTMRRLQVFFRWGGGQPSQRRPA